MSRICTVAALALLLVSGAFAATYPVTAGTLSYTNDYFGALGDTFSFTGPQVSVAGGGATFANYTTLQSLGVPFGFSMALAIDDDDAEGGAATANGTTYPSVQYANSFSTATLHASSSVTLTSGNLTVSVPAYIDGILYVCSTLNACAYAIGTPVHVFDASFGPMTGTLTLTFAQ